MDLDLPWIIEKVVVPLASAIGGGLLVARQARRSFHETKLNEEEATAYKAVLADFKVLRASAAYSRRMHIVHWPPSLRAAVGARALPN